MATNSILSAGKAINYLLSQSAEVRALAKHIYPGVSLLDNEMPYVAYRRTSLQQTPTKSGALGAMSANIEVLCVAGNYDQSVALAEAVNAALENKSFVSDGLSMRSCMLFDGAEYQEGDAYINQLTYSIKI